MQTKIAAWLREGAVFLARRILVFVLLLAGIVAASFFLWGPFSAAAYSDRLVYTGLVMALVAGLLVSAQTVGGRSYGVPGQFMGSVHGQNVIDFNIEVRAAIETKMGVFARMFVIGVLVFGLGALVSALFA